MPFLYSPPPNLLSARRRQIQRRQLGCSQGLAACKADWDRVLATLTRRRHFHRFEWYRSYLDTLEPDPDSVRFYVAYRAGRPIAVFPLTAATKTQPVAIGTPAVNPSITAPYWPLILASNPKDVVVPTA